MAYFTRTLRIWVFWLVLGIAWCTLSPVANAQTDPQPLIHIADMNTNRSPVTTNVDKQEITPTNLAENQVIIPGTSITVPRIAVITTLVLLMIAMCYLFYAEIRERRTSFARKYNGDDAPYNPFSLQVDGQPYAGYDTPPAAKSDIRWNGANALPPANTSQFHQMNWTTPNGSQGSTNGYHKAGHPLANQRNHTGSQHGMGYSMHGYDPNGEQVDDSITAAVIQNTDDEVTYWVDEIEQLPLGYLVRETDDMTLPAKLPIHGVSGADNTGHYIHVGRNQKYCAIVIKSQYISRDHAVIVQKGDRLYLRDNKSTAGTFLNQYKLKLDQELLLRNNDCISLGSINYIFHSRENCTENCTER